MTDGPAPRLSICIPTHEGRAAALDDALASVFAQLGETDPGRVEVCVSDNGSTDATREVVERHGDRAGSLGYHRFERNQGFLANLLATAELARGDFCWFLASDDAATTGGIARLLRRLDEHPEVAGATLRPVAYDLALERELGPWVPVVHPPRPDEPRVLATKDDAVGACTLLIGLISALVVRREDWLESVARLGSEELSRWPYHPHTRVVMDVLDHRPGWLWVPDPVLSVRTGQENSTLEALDGDVATYHLRTTREVETLIAEAVGRRSRAYRQTFRRSFRFGWRPLMVASWKVRGLPAPVDRELLRALPRWFWWLPEFWLTLAPLLVVPARWLPSRALLALSVRLRRAA